MTQETREAVQLLEGGKFFEGPRWHDGAWYVSDLYNNHVVRVGTDGSSEVVTAVEGQPSGLGWLPDGRLLVIAMKTQKVMRLDDDGVLREHGDAGAHSINLSNDMAVDGRGNAYVATFGFDFFNGGQPVPGNIVHVRPDGSAGVGAEELLFANGMVVTPDDGTLIVAETFGGRLSAFDIAADGSLGNRRVFAQLSPTQSWDSFETMLQTGLAPDGIALDAEGHVWVADALNGRAVRVAEGGDIVDEVKAPNGWGLYSVALGGDDGRTLLACVAPTFAEAERRAADEGMLFTYEVDVPRAGHAA
jgi:sugar lactone lactonase YvrE